MPVRRPYSYHVPPMWTNYSFYGTRETAVQKAIELFVKEEWLDVDNDECIIDAILAMVEANDLFKVDENDSYEIWKTMAPDQQELIRKRCYAQRVEFYCDEHNSGVIAWDGIKDEYKISRETDVLEVVELP